MQTTGTGASDFTPRMQKANGSTSNVSSHGTSLGPSNSGGAFGGLKSMLSRKATVAGRQRSGSEATSVRSARRPTADGFEPVGDGHSERQLSTPVREKPEPIPERPPSKREPSGTRASVRYGRGVWLIMNRRPRSIRKATQSRRRTATSPCGTSRTRSSPRPPLVVWLPAQQPELQVSPCHRPSSRASAAPRPV